MEWELSIQITGRKGSYIREHELSCNRACDLALLRHPPVVAVAGSCYGRLDLPLAPGWEGWAVAQAQHLAALAPERIWTSPARRCLSVADALAGRLGLAVTPDERLLELDFGEWEGRAWDDVPRAAIDRWAGDPLGFRPPGGESGAALIGRVAGFAQMLTDAGRPCAVISHGGPLRLLPALLRGEPVDLLAASPGLGTLQVVRIERGARRTG